MMDRNSWVKRRTIPWVFLGLFMHSALAEPLLTLPHVAGRVQAHQNLLVTAFGSSSTEGVGATSKDHSYPARLQVYLATDLPRGIAATVINRGIGGEDVDDMIARLSQIIAEKPDLVIWQTGSNDALRLVPLDHFLKETIAGIEQMQRAGIDVMLMEPQMASRLAGTKQGEVFVQAVRDIGQRTHVVVIHRYDLMRQWLSNGTLTYRQMMSTDGLHMSDGGYDLLAKAVAETIMAAITPEVTPAVAR
jgi:lysophospholipase L1-like esterase